jgi:hypothetical protein
MNQYPVTPTLRQHIVLSYADLRARAGPGEQGKIMCSVQKPECQHCDQALCLLHVSSTMPTPPLFIQLYLRQCFDMQVVTKFRRSLAQSLRLTSRSQYSMPQPTQAALISVSSGVESSLLLDLMVKECFSRESSSNPLPKPLNKLQQLWTRYYLAYVEICAAVPGVCTIHILSPSFLIFCLSEKIGRKACEMQLIALMAPTWLSSVSRMLLTTLCGSQCKTLPKI